MRRWILGTTVPMVAALSCLQANAIEGRGQSIWADNVVLPGFQQRLLHLAAEGCACSTPVILRETGKAISVANSPFHKPEARKK